VPVDTGQCGSVTEIETGQVAGGEKNLTDRGVGEVECALGASHHALNLSRVVHLSISWVRWWWWWVNPRFVSNVETTRSIVGMYTATRRSHLPLIRGYEVSPE
jgi:hypothetical protein